MNKQQTVFGVALNVLVLGLTSFLTDVSSEMVFALLPFFMVSALGAPLAFVGLIEGAAESTASLLKVFSGWWSDKIHRRKPFAVFGYSLSAFLKPLFAFASQPVHVLLLRVSERVGKGVRTAPRDALIADSIDENVRGKAYGLHRSFDTLGAVLGPLLAFLFFPIVYYQGVFLLSLVPALVAVIILVLFVKEKASPKTTEKTMVTLSGFKRLDRRFMVFVLIAGVFTFSNFSYAFFLLRAKDFGLPESLAILLYLLFNIVYALSAYPMGVLADKIGKRLVISLGYAVFGVTCLLFALGSLPWHGFFLFILYGFSFAIADTAQRALVPDMVSPEQRGVAFGMFHAVVGVVAFPSSLAAGLLWQLYGSAIPFMLSAAIAIFSAILVLTVVPMEKK